MTIQFHRNFEKQYRKLRSNQQKKVQERLSLFLRNQFDPILNNHPLRGKYQDYRSVNVGGDLRAIYKMVSDMESIFVAVGTHNKLYS